MLDASTQFAGFDDRPNLGHRTPVNVRMFMFRLVMMVLVMMFMFIMFIMFIMLIMLIMLIDDE